MDANILKAGARPDPLPERLQVCEPRARFRSHDHPRISLNTLDLLQHLNRGLAEMHDLGAGLGVRQPQRLAGDVHVIPFQRS